MRRILVVNGFYWLFYEASYSILKPISYITEKKMIKISITRRYNKNDTVRLKSI